MCIVYYIIYILYIIYKAFKVGLPPSKNFVFIYFNGSSLKIMKNVFYFILKAYIVLEIFTLFVLTFWLSRKTA